MNKSPWNDDEDDDKYKSKNNIEDIFSKFKGKKPNFDFINFDFKNFKNNKFSFYVFLAIVGLWLLSGVYKVNEGEQAAIIRFGKYVRKADAGLNYHLPAPIELVIKELVNKSRSIEIGYRSNGYNNESKFIPHESIMLTGDENIVDLNCVVMWHINNVEKYLFNIAQPEEAVKIATQSAIREVIGESQIVAVLSNQKQELESKIEKVLQNTLELYDAGIQIEMVQLLKVDPPSEVLNAYRDVQTSKADKERMINQALAYNNDIIPKARGETAKILQEAEGYKQEVISKAEGDSKRFLSIYGHYVTQKQIVKDRLFLEAVEDVLSKSQKYILGNETLPHMAISKNKN